MNHFRVFLCPLRAFAVPFLLLVAGCAHTPGRETLLRVGRSPDPPAMTHREIVKPPDFPTPAAIAAGEATYHDGGLFELMDGESRFVLFVPASYRLPADGAVDLAVHFHTAVWFAIDEHLRRGLTGPLLIGYLGEGSTTYGKPFKDPELFGRLIGRVEQALSRRANGSSVHVNSVAITSFSAGYGAVREILKEDRYIALIRRIILCDSLYAGWDPATTQPGATSQPALENMQPFEKYVRLAAAGEKTFVLVHSSVPTPYANTAATAKWIAELVDAPRVDIARGSSPASSDEDFPLLYRADIGHLHLWGYGGEDAQAHMTHVRHLADVWMALDACGEP